MCELIGDGLHRIEDQDAYSDAKLAERVDTLVIFSFSHSDDGSREDNLFFWLTQGLVWRSRYHFILIMNGNIDQSWLRVLENIASSAVSFEWHQRPNRGKDVCAWHDVLRSKIRLRNRMKTFSRFILMSASCRGPFLPRSHREHWPEVFLSMLDAHTALAGASIHCGCQCAGERTVCISPAERLHVQGHLLAFDLAALPLVLALQDGICAPGSGRNASGFEGSLTQRVLANGSNVAVTQYLWAGVDLRDRGAAARMCAYAAPHGLHCGDPPHPPAYGGAAAHPLELVFLETARSVAPATLGALTRTVLATRAWAVPRGLVCP